MISVAVVCRAKGFDETRLKLGWWSHGVPDLDWAFYPAIDGQVINKDRLAAQGHDLIVWEDWVWNTWEGTSSIPIYAVMVDSNTSPRRRRNYIARAKQADVILVDQDHLKTFRGMGKPVYRWSYGVNPAVFRAQDKTVDVAYHVQHTDDRSKLHDYLRGWTQNNSQWRVTMGGNMTIAQYAVRIGQARIVVHKRTHEQCRSHRFFDALAAGCCLLTDRGWSVNEDGFRPGHHFLEWNDYRDLTEMIERLLETNEWTKYANVGQAFVLSRHTWAHRAAEFIRIVEDTRASI